MRRLASIVALLALTACPPPPAPPDGGMAGGAGGSTGRQPCLDRPGEPEAAPGSALPCDLLPPGFGQ